MFCGNCGKEIKKDTLYCPWCGAKNCQKDEGAKKIPNKKHRKVPLLLWIIILAVIVLIGIFISRFFLVTSVDKIVVNNVDDAIVKLSEKGEDLGFENALSELTEKDTTKVDGDSYYRLQQNYKGIPVYGKTVNCVTDENGTITSITGNVIDVANDVNLEKTLSNEQVIQSINTYITEQLGLEDEYTINAIDDLDKSNLYLYETGNMGEFSLVYCINIGTMEYIIDAQNGTIYTATEKVQNVFAYSASDSSRTKGYTVDLTNDGDYVMKNAEQRISVWNLHGKSHKKESAYKESTEVTSEDDIFGNDESEKGYDRALELYSNVGKVSEYFKNKCDFDYEELWLFINDGLDFGLNASGGIFTRNPETGGYIGQIAVGNKMDYNDIDVLSHEYGHLMSFKYVDWTDSKGETSAVNEGLSDVFGELCEEVQQGRTDWYMDVNYITENAITEGMLNSAFASARNIADPSDTDNAESFSEYSNRKDQYYNSTIISHTAYLMSNGIDGNESKKIATDDLIKLWYRTMLMMPSDCDFIQCRRLAEYAARSMEELSDVQRKCVSEAFDKVGIFNVDKESVKVDYHLRPNSKLKVLDCNNEYYSGYTLQISGIIDSLSKENSTVSQIDIGHYHNSIHTVDIEGPYKLKLYNGLYRFTVSDQYNEDIYSFVVKINDEGKENNITLITSYKVPPLVVPIDDNNIPYNPELYDEIMGEYEQAITMFSEIETTSMAKRYPHVSEFLVSEYIERGTPIWYGYYDIDGNGVEELFFSYETIEGCEYKIVDVFSQDGEQVKLVGENNTFSEHTGSDIYENGVIYSNHENQENYYMINSDGYHLDITEKPTELGEKIKIEWHKLELANENPANSSKEDMADSASSNDLFADVSIGFWYADGWYEGYMFYEDGRFERYHVAVDYDGGIKLINILEEGIYEIVNSQLIKLYPGGDRYSWQEFTYNAQDKSITNGIVYKKIEDFNK